MKKKKNDKSASQQLPLTVRAIAVMMERRPNANNDWDIKFTDAKYWFMLPIDTMTKFCTELPEEHWAHLTQEGVERVKKGYTTYMNFLDAYKLALSSSKLDFKVAMERRDRLYKKLADSARASLVFRWPSLVMHRNILAAIRAVKRGEQNAQTKKGLRLLSKLESDIRMSCWKQDILAKSLRVQMRSVELLRSYIADYNTARRTLVARYKAHSVYCPEKMPMDGLE